MLYELLIKDKAGNTLASLDGARNRGFEIYLNRTGKASFNISTKDPKISQDLLLTGNKELYFYRSGVLVWGGELVYSRFDVSEQNENAQINAKGFLDLLSKRIVGSTTTPRAFAAGTDAVTIAQTIINESQALTNGDLGFTIGTTPTSSNHERTYIFDNLKEAIEGLSNLKIADGFDFEVTPDKQVNFFYPAKGHEIDEAVFEYGVNLTSFYQTLDATDLANEIIVLGSGQGDAMITATIDSDPTLQSVYKLRQKVLNYKDIDTVATLTEHGNKDLSLNQAQKQIAGVTVKGNLLPTFGTYSVGDSVRIKISHGIINIDAFFRIYGIKVGISDDDEETIELIFNQD